MPPEFTTIENEQVEIHTRDSDDECLRFTVESVSNPSKITFGHLSKMGAIEAFKRLK